MQEVDIAVAEVVVVILLSPKARSQQVKAVILMPIEPFANRLLD